MKKISACLWFDTNAEEAVKHYTSIFKNSRIGTTARFGKAGFDQHGQKEGTVSTIQFFLEDEEFLALNGGPHFKFNEAISFTVTCDTQEEIDYYWEKLSAGGDPKAQQCGWLKDKFGMSWQITPRIMSEYFDGNANENSERVMEAMMKMKKLDIEKLREAYEGVPA